MKKSVLVTKPVLLENVFIKISFGKLTINIRYFIFNSYYLCIKMFVLTKPFVLGIFYQHLQSFFLDFVY